MRCCDQGVEATRRRSNEAEQLDFPTERCPIDLGAHDRGMQAASTAGAGARCGDCQRNWSLWLRAAASEPTPLAGGGRPLPRQRRSPSLRRRWRGQPRCCGGPQGSHRIPEPKRLRVRVRLCPKQGAHEARPGRSSQHTYLCTCLHTPGRMGTLPRLASMVVRKDDKHTLSTSAPVCICMLSVCLVSGSDYAMCAESCSACDTRCRRARCEEDGRAG